MGGEFPPVLLVHMGSPEQGERFLASRWPEARAVSDEDRRIYTGFGLQRGTLGQMLGPRVLWSGLRAMLSGHGVGLPVGDVRMLSGWFLVHGKDVHWEHRHEHTGVARPFEELAQVWGRMGAERAV